MVCMLYRLFEGVLGEKIKLAYLGVRRNVQEVRRGGDGNSKLVTGAHFKQNVTCKK